MANTTPPSTSATTIDLPCPASTSASSSCSESSLSSNCSVKRASETKSPSSETEAKIGESRFCENLFDGIPLGVKLAVREFYQKKLVENKVSFEQIINTQYKMGEHSLNRGFGQEECSALLQLKQNAPFIMNKMNEDRNGLRTLPRVDQHLNLLSQQSSGQAYRPFAFDFVNKILSVFPVSIKDIKDINSSAEAYGIAMTNLSRRCNCMFNEQAEADTDSFLGHAQAAYAIKTTYQLINNVFGTNYTLVLGDLSQSDLKDYRPDTDKGTVVGGYMKFSYKDKKLMYVSQECDHYGYRWQNSSVVTAFTDFIKAAGFTFQLDLSQSYQTDSNWDFD